MTHSPFGGAPLASLPLSTPQDIVVAVDAARAAQRTWARTPLELRERILLRYHDLVLDRQAQLLDLVQLESGKTRPPSLRGGRRCRPWPVTTRAGARTTCGLAAGPECSRC